MDSARKRLSAITRNQRRDSAITKKKSSTKHTRTRIEDRAFDILEDKGRYDGPTRRFVERAITEGDAARLAEAVRMAERGDSLLDTAAEDENDRRQGAKVAAFINDSELPEWLTEGVVKLVGTVADLRNFEFSDDGGQYGDELGKLFGLTPPRLKLDAPDFAVLLSMALNHPDCPAEIYNAVGECDCLAIRRWDTPAAIRLALGTAAQIEAPKPGKADPDALAIVRLLNSPRMPGDIKRALGEAVDSYVDEHRDTSPAIVSAVLSAAQKDEASGESDLARLLSEVFNHPDVPEEFYNSLIDGVNLCVSSSAINHHAGYLRAILAEHAPKKGGE